MNGVVCWGYIQDAAWPADSWHPAATTKNLALALYRRQRYTDAEQIFLPITTSMLAPYPEATAIHHQAFTRSSS